MEEMMEETMDMVDDDEIEEEADAEVDKVLFELTDGKLGQAGRVGGELPVSAASQNVWHLLKGCNYRRRRRTKKRTWPRCKGCRGRCRIS